MDEKNLDQIELLLSQSLRGCHHLFQNTEIAQILATPTESIDFFNSERMERIQGLFTELIDKYSFDDKKDYLSTLDSESYEILLRTYFHIVDNSAMASTQLKH